MLPEPRPSLSVWTKWDASSSSAASHQRVWTVTEFWSRVWVAIAAIVIASTARYAVIVVARIPLWVLRRRSKSRSSSTSDRLPLLNGHTALNQNYGSANGSATTNGDAPAAQRRWDRMKAKLSNNSSTRDGLRMILVHLADDGLPFTRGAILLLFATILLACGVGLIAGGISVGRLRGGTVALSASKICGLYGDPKASGEPGADREYLRQSAMEMRAGDYASHCYKGHENSAPFQCNYFNARRIRYTTRHNQLCPFEDASLCYGFDDDTIVFDTGLINANTIGINTGKNYTFQRTTACSPLNMNNTFITSDVSGDNATYFYWYGKSEQGSVDFTDYTEGNAIHWPLPVYSLKAFYSSLNTEEDFWWPREGLAPKEDRKHKTVTLLMLRSGLIFHLEQRSESQDPVFPATSLYQDEGGYGDLYYNGNPKARMLACVDSTRLCNSEGCWWMNSEEGPHISKDMPYWFMKFSLQHSNIFDSVFWRQGSALLAQKKISGFVSLDLEERQWEAEVEQLFATSLARIQWDAMSISEGEGQNEDGYKDMTPKEAIGGLCDMFKYRAAGYSDISLVGIGVVLGVCLLIWTLSLSCPKFLLRFAYTTETESASDEEAQQGADRTEEQVTGQGPPIVQPVTAQQEAGASTEGNHAPQAHEDLQDQEGSSSQPARPRADEAEEEGGESRPISRADPATEHGRHDLPERCDQTHPENEKLSEPNVLVIEGILGIGLAATLALWFGLRRIIYKYVPS